MTDTDCDTASSIPGTATYINYCFFTGHIILCRAYDCRIYHSSLLRYCLLCALFQPLVVSKLSRCQTFVRHSPYSRILHIGTITRQLLLMADRACSCWFFFKIIISMALYSIWNMLYNYNCRLLMFASVQTCSNCPDRVTDEMKTFTSQCKKLRKGHDGIRNYDAYRVDFSTSISDRIRFFKDSFLSRFTILISWTLHRKLCIAMK